MKVIKSLSFDKWFNSGLAIKDCMMSVSNCKSITCYERVIIQAWPAIKYSYLLTNSYVIKVSFSIPFNQLPWAESVKLPHMYFHVIYSCEDSRFMKSQFFTFIAFEFRGFFPVFFLDVTFQPTFLIASPIAYLLRFQV